MQALFVCAKMIRPKTRALTFAIPRVSASVLVAAYSLVSGLGAGV